MSVISDTKIKKELDKLQHEKEILDFESARFGYDYSKFYQTLELKKEALENDPESYFREKYKEIWNEAIKIFLTSFQVTAAAFSAYILFKGWNSIFIKSLFPELEKPIIDVFGMKFSLHILSLNIVFSLLEFQFLFYLIGKFYSLIYDLWKKEDEFSDEEVFF